MLIANIALDLFGPKEQNGTHLRCATDERNGSERASEKLFGNKKEGERDEVNSLWYCNVHLK